MRNSGNLGKNRCRASDEKESNSGYMSKVEPRFADGVNVGYGNETGVKDSIQVLALSN